MSRKISSVTAIAAITFISLIHTAGARAEALPCQAESVAAMTTTLNAMSPALSSWNLKDQGKLLTIDGNVTSLATVSSLLRNMDTSPHFEKTVLVSVVRSPSNMDNLEFKITFESKCAAPKR